MKSISGKTFAKALERYGWLHRRTSGSHWIYGKPGVMIVISVPIHASRDMKRGTLLTLIKAACLTEDDL